MSDPRVDWRTRYDWRTRPIRLDDADVAALTGAEPKLVRIPPAHWRGVYRLGPIADCLMGLLHAVRGEGVGADPLGGGVWRETRKHVSAEMCEQRGLKDAAEGERMYGPGECAFIRAEKFEGEGL